MSKEEEDDEFIEKILKSLDDDANEYILELTTEKIHRMNDNALKELHLTKQTHTTILNQLKNYIIVDELQQLKYGFFVRWISLIDPKNLYLNRGAIFCEVKVTDGGLDIIVKNYRNQYFSIKFDEVLLFQKLSNQELVLLSAMDHLSKTKKK